MTWIDKLVNKYIKEHRKNLSENWDGFSSSLKRIRTSPEAVDKELKRLVANDIDFSVNQKSWLSKELSNLEVKAEEVKEATVHLNTHLMRIKRRENFLATNFAGLLAIALTVFLAIARIAPQSELGPFFAFVSINLLGILALWERWHLHDHRVALEELMELLRSLGSDEDELLKD